MTESDVAAELIARCQQGDPRALSRLLAETQSGVYSLAYNILRNPSEAEDMTQEVYIRAWRALPGFRGESKFSTWLYRIAVNTCLNRRRQLRSQLYMVDGEEALGRYIAPEDDPLEAALNQERNEWLWAAVDRLPEKYRLVITLFYQQQLSYQEVAGVLAIPVGTIKAHLNRARQALAQSLRLRQEKQHDAM